MTTAKRVARRHQIRVAGRYLSMALSQAKGNWGQALVLLGPRFKSMAVAHELVGILSVQEPLDDPEAAQRQLTKVLDELVEGAKL